MNFWWIVRCGLKRRELKVFREKETLFVSGERQFEIKDTQQRVLRQERP